MLLINIVFHINEVPSSISMIIVEPIFIFGFTKHNMTCIHPYTQILI